MLVDFVEEIVCPVGGELIYRNAESLGAGEGKQTYDAIEILLLLPP